QSTHEVWKGLELVEQQALRHGLGQVEHVVERSDQRVDVRAIDGGNPGLVKIGDRLMRDLVARLFGLGYLTREFGNALGMIGDLEEESASAQDAGCMLLESSIKRAVVL